MKSSIVKIAILTVILHFIIVAMFVSTPLFGSNMPDNQLAIVIPMSTTHQMAKMNLSPLAVSNILRNGTKLSSHMQHRFLYICNETQIGVVHDEVSGMVVNIIPKICAYEFQKQQDAANKKKRVHIKAKSY